MITTDEASLTALNALTAVCHDGQFGYERAAVEIGDAELGRLLGELAAQRMKFADALAGRVRLLRGQPVERGTPAGAAHRAWMKRKADTASARRHAILAECERAEDISVKAYRAALEMADLDEQTRRLIQEQYEQVQLAHDRIRQLRDSPAYAYR
jgi:uncharacterized protein (TIGR02284 family)